MAFAVGQPDALGPGHDADALLRQLGVGGEGVHVVGGVEGLEFGGGQVVGDLVHGVLAAGGPESAIIRCENMIK